MKRRDFILSLSTLTATTAIATEGSYLFLNSADQILNQDLLVQQAAQNGLSILQGLTTQTTTQLSIDVPTSMICEYVLTDNATNQVVAASALNTLTFEASAFKVDKLIYTGLELGHTYTLKVINKKNNAVVDERTLTTVDLEKTNARIAMLSCMRDSASSIKNMWASALDANVDYFMFLGDNVYGDLGGSGPAILWQRYIETRAKIPFYRWKTLKPVIAIWDDHDFGVNNAGGSYKHRDNSLAQFNTFFAQEPIDPAMTRVNKNSWCFKAFQQNFVMFDNRYYRNLKNADSSKSFVGIAQIDEMDKLVQTSTLPTFVLEGSPFFGRMSKDSYQASAPQELNYLLNKIKAWKSPALFGCGDLHYTELARTKKDLVGYETYEFVTSSMHSSRRGVVYEQPNQRLNVYEQDNFLILEKTGRPEDLTWNMTCVGANSQRHFATALKI